MANNKGKSDMNRRIVDIKATESHACRQAGEAVQSPIVVLDNIRSLHNVGAIFRTCDGAGIKKVFLCGMTGTPPRREITKTALGAEDTIEWEYRKDPVRLLRTLKKQGYDIVALEKTDTSKLFNKVKYSPKMCFVVGHEISGVKPGILKEADKIVHIPMRGSKESLNVATAFGIGIYEVTRFLYDTHGEKTD